MMKSIQLSIMLLAISFAACKLTGSHLANGIHYDQKLLQNPAAQYAQYAHRGLQCGSQVTLANWAICGAIIRQRSHDCVAWNPSENLYSNERLYFSKVEIQGQ